MICMSGYAQNRRSKRPGTNFVRLGPVCLPRPGVPPSTVYDSLEMVGFSLRDGTRVEGQLVGERQQSSPLALRQKPESPKLQLLVNRKD